MTIILKKFDIIYRGIKKMGDTWETIKKSRTVGNYAFKFFCIKTI